MNYRLASNKEEEEAQEYGRRETFTNKKEKHQ